ncbi:MAG: right-handed parallel beta-helix repeat-containing protein [Planctomycetes bacterium]|nr:right-handed parallel beta-helix repeat-containing protein [Planctomycetota bacterium]
MSHRSLARLLPPASAAILATAIACAVDLHVAPGGKDSQPGTYEQPFATLQRAQQAARAAAAKGAVTVRIHGGTYYLAETLVFTAADSGTEQAPVIYRAEPGQDAVLSGGARLELQWRLYRDGILQASTPEDLEIDQLFVNGQRQPMARYPNYDPDVLVYGGYDRNCFAPERAARWKDPAGGYIHAMHSASWGGMHYRITGKDAENRVTYEGGWQNNRPSRMHGEHRFVENIFEELDAPGEWFHDAKTRTLYCYPPEGVDLKTATVEVVRLRHLIELRGSKESPVRWITLQGLTFRHAARTFMENKEPLLRSDWTTYRGGAVFLTGAEDCRLIDCELDQVGGNAIFASAYNRRIAVRGCHIHESGANGVAFVGSPDAVRSPLFNYGETFDYAKIDRTPGPRGDDYPADCIVEDCLITRNGRVEKQTAPVQISMAESITVRHCSIYEVPRAGINISEGTWGGHLIEFCDIFDTVLETGDHGSFNSWGRDRYWHPDLRTVDREVAADPALPFLDARRPTVLRNNRWRCDHGWDIDLDDGSTNYRIESNLLLRGGLKMREGYRRIATNNILVNDTLHPHCWFEKSGDVFRGNIVMGSYRPAVMNIAKWGETVDFNLFTTSEDDRARFAKNGCDEHSIVGDPMFVDPESGDFRVRDGSPALAIGFQNFPMDRFGVRKPELRAIARTPEIPALRQPAGADRMRPRKGTSSAASRSR